MNPAELAGTPGPPRGQTPGSPQVPVAIGGMGGSGTRLVARIVGQLGWYLGDDLNAAVDNLWFTLLFKRIELGQSDGGNGEFILAVETFRTAMTGGCRLTAEQEAWVSGLGADRPQHDSAWLQQRIESLLVSTRTSQRRSQPWGWKEPNTHVFLDRLAGAYPDMKYIHVVRNGLDMAYSSNQNQLHLWGPLFLGGKPEPAPRGALKYWCAMQRRIACVAEQMPGRFLMVSYDALCRAPAEQLEALMDFVGVTPDPATRAAALACVRVPDTIGRFKAHGLGAFDKSDVEYVRDLGFDVGTDDREVPP